MSYPTDEDLPTRNALAPLPQCLDAKALGLSFEIRPETIAEIEAIEQNSRRAMAMARFIIRE